MNSVEPLKCAGQLTDDSWPGWLMSVGQYAATGITQGWTPLADTVMVRSGGTASVSIRAAGVERIFRRRSGMVDPLPTGIVLERIEWQGEATASVSTSADEQPAVTLARYGRRLLSSGA